MTQAGSTWAIYGRSPQLIEFPRPPFVSITTLVNIASISYGERTM